MAIGYFWDITDAEDYFDNERFDSSPWDEIATDAEKTKLLINSYNRLYYDPRWELPTRAEATADELVKLRKANGEMAIYIAEHLADEDRRKGIQAQGVIKAGIVKEDYSPNMLNDLPVPPFVIALLAGWEILTKFVAVGVSRDEEEDSPYVK